jgi:hypothetical protein
MGMSGILIAIKESACKMEKTIQHNFWYISCSGSYASGMWCPFESKEEAIAYIKKEIGDSKIVFEGIDKYGDYTIKISYKFGFDEYSISQRKDNEILKEEYIE